MMVDNITFYACCDLLRVVVNNYWRLTLLNIHLMYDWVNKLMHRASISMYSLTFCVRVMLPERHQWKPAVQAAAVMLRTLPRRRPIIGQSATPTSYIRRAILRTPPVTASHRPAARAHLAKRSHYVVISRDGRKLVTRVRVMLP